MTIEIALLFAIIIALILLFAFEVLPPDTLAISLMTVLMVGGFVTPSEGLSGLSNQATVTVLALMILSVGLESTGVITQIGKRLKTLFNQKDWIIIVALMLIVGTCSAFISTTAVVIVFLRIVIKLTRKNPSRLAKFLMPLSFAGILGGSCTLIGTSTNLLVSSIARDYDIEPFRVFEFSYIGVIFFAAGVLYMLLAGRHLISKRKKEPKNLIKEYTLENYFTEVVVQEGSRLIGKKLDKTDFFTNNEIDLIEVKRENGRGRFPNEVDTLQAGDILLVKGTVDNIAELRDTNELSLLALVSENEEERLTTEDMILCEVMIRPGSPLLGKTLDKLSLRREYKAIPLAIRKNKRYYTARLDIIRLEVGDTILMEIGKSAFERFYNDSDFIVLQEHEDLSLKSSKRYLASGIMIGVIGLAAFSVLPILVSALIGCVLMMITGCLDLQEAYRKVDWSVFFLLAGVIPLGIAMDNTGASQLIADQFVTWFGDVSTRVLIGVLFLFTALFSAVISNNATAILLAPIAVSIAGNLQVDPRPLLLTVMFAANTSFLSPIGYQTNMLIYGPGDYNFKDFFLVGGLLTLIIWGLATLLIPMFYF